MISSTMRGCFAARANVPMRHYSRTLTSCWRRPLISSGITRPDIFVPSDDQNISSMSLKSLRHSYASSDRGFRRHVTRKHHYDVVFHRYELLQPLLKMFVQGSFARPKTDDWGNGPLFGIPGDVKDHRGLARKFLPAVQQAGACVLGRTRSSPMMFFPAAPGVGNPYDPEKTCGGSSSGGAVSVACGISSFSIGSNGGGSSRLPAAFCGIHGLLLEPGLRLRREPSADVDQPDVTENTNGLMVRFARDAAILLDAVTEPIIDEGETEPLVDAGESPAAENLGRECQTVAITEPLPVPGGPIASTQRAAESKPAGCQEGTAPAVSAVLRYHFEHSLSIPRSLRVLVVRTLDADSELIPEFPPLQPPKMPMWQKFEERLLALEGSVRFLKEDDVSLPNIVQPFLVRWMDSYRHLAFRSSSPASERPNGATDDASASDNALIEKYALAPMRALGKQSWMKMVEEAKTQLREAASRMQRLFDRYDLIVSPAVLTGPWLSAYACPAFGPPPTYLGPALPGPNPHSLTGMIDARFNPYLPLLNNLQTISRWKPPGQREEGVYPGVALVGPCGIDGDGMPMGYQVATRGDPNDVGKATKNVLAVAQLIEKSIVGRVIPPVFPRLWLEDATDDTPLLPSQTGMAANFNDPFSW
eukprot:TRINITY_DN23228_c0_g1_i1.p1 TRINITY_DN23228_c0_g1~~TRINITY_DN23228_c0_g1_i1.p1  ORF type:complete len:645 (+),score=50.04 TRINITY_DN23228_c0_g1_i1:92-2026(+)